MGLLSSIITLGLVAGFGWFTIYYLIPKIEAGELGAAGLVPSTTANASEGSAGEESLITDELMDVLTGQESGTTEAEPEPAAPTKEEKKKKKKNKQEYRIIQYLYERG